MRCIPKTDEKKIKEEKRKKKDEANVEGENKKTSKGLHLKKVDWRKLLG